MSEQVLDLLNCFKIEEVVAQGWKILWVDVMQDFKHYCVKKGDLVFKLEANRNGALIGYLNLNDCHCIYKHGGEIENA